MVRSTLCWRRALKIVQFLRYIGRSRVLEVKLLPGKQKACDLAEVQKPLNGWSLEKLRLEGSCFGKQRLVFKCFGIRRERTKQRRVQSRF